MNNAQHTPGPWKLETQRAPNGGTYYRIYDSENAGNVIAQVIGDGRIERLIAAAPDLLAALEETLDAFDRDANHQPSTEEAGAIIDRALKAIAKAKGVQA
jgi:hypothetical protein